MVRLTSVIWLGVMRVPTSRRVIASEMRRSTWRDMNPSVSLIRLRSSHSSAAWAPAAPPSAKRPAGSPASLTRARRCESAVMRSCAPTACGRAQHLPDPGALHHRGQGRVDRERLRIERHLAQGA